MLTAQPTDRVNGVTRGVAVPVLDSDELQATAQLLGTVHDDRGRWNPFLPDNNMTKDGDLFYREVELRATGGRHCDGVYALRFSKNHDLHQMYKAHHKLTDGSGKPRLLKGDDSHRAHNIMIRVEHDGLYRITFDPSAMSFDISPAPKYLTEIETIQLNGFVWDDEPDFAKFDETRPNHNMTKNCDWWEMTVPLRKNGGIDFRRDGVYQFLFSANHNEDWGFGAFNGPERGRLCGGTGFGSSGGQSRNSGITIRVLQDGDYTIRMNPGEFLFEVKETANGRPIEYLNTVDSFQLLGTIFEQDSFDPTKPGREMILSEEAPREWQKTVNLNRGIYGANFAISRELFLDTMALGAWLPSSDPVKRRGRAWHGKPNEPNIFFKVNQRGAYRFVYDSITDEFAIESLDGWPVEPCVDIDSLQLVGDPVGNWDPLNSANDMERLQESVFRKTVALEAGQTYQYKFTANRWGWTWTFADYELDGYGCDYLGRNPAVLTSRLEDLRRFGHLTTHGNPDPLQCRAEQSGDHVFLVDLRTGAYSVHQSSS